MGNPGLHLIGNMLFLWVFSNAVCAKVGNALYPIIYLVMGGLSGVSHLLFDGDPRDRGERDGQRNCRYVPCLVSLKFN